METIKAKKSNLTWNVVDVELRKFNTRTKSYYTVECAKCGYRKTGQKANIQHLSMCPGCSEKPAGLKTDSSGNCVTICRMGQLEYIHQLITEEEMTQQGAAESFIEAVQAHSNAGDPITSELTVEMVRSQYRRDSGKLKEKPRKPLVESTKETTDNPITKAKGEKEYSCLATIAGVQAFLNMYLPGFKIVPACLGQGKKLNTMEQRIT